MNETQCGFCRGTGFYGDNGPGIAGNNEYHECDHCGPPPPKTMAQLIKALCKYAKRNQVSWQSLPAADDTILHEMKLIDLRTGNRRSWSSCDAPEKIARWALAELQSEEPCELCNHHHEAGDRNACESTYDHVHDRAGDSP